MLTITALHWRAISPVSSVTVWSPYWKVFLIAVTGVFPNLNKVVD
jgi:hypothetical protein